MLGGEWGCCINLRSQKCVLLHWRGTEKLAIFYFGCFLQYIAPLNWLTHDIVVENVCLKKHSHSIEMLVLSNIEEDETILENGGNSWFLF